VEVALAVRCQCLWLETEQTGWVVAAADQVVHLTWRQTVKLVALAEVEL